jgi:hypothetical protein
MFKKADFWVRLFVGGVFVFAGLMKWISPVSGTMFGDLLNPSTGLGITAISAELILGMWIIVGWWNDQALTIAIGVLSLFVGAMVCELFKSHPRPCGCMGALAAAYEPSAIRLSLTLSIGRNVVLLFGAGWLFFRRDGKPKGIAAESNALVAAM